MLHASHISALNVPIIQESTIVEEQLCDKKESSIPIDDTIVDEYSLRKSQRVHKPVISYDYMIYLQEHDDDVCDVSNPVTY